MTKTRFVLTTGSLVVLLGILAGCSSPRLQFARAEKLESSGKPGEALAIYQRLTDEIPAPNARTRSQAYYRMGEVLYGLDRIPEAFSAFQKAADTEPANLAAHLRLGEVFLSAGAPGRARDQAEMVLKFTPENPEATALLGAAMAASGETEQAKAAYRKVLRAEPGRVAVAVALAQIYNQEDSTGQASQVLHESAVANPRSSLPWLALGRLEEQEGDAGAAETAYRKAVANEDTPETNLRLAQFLQRTGRVNESEQVLRRVDAQRPTQPTALPDFELMAGKPDAAQQGYQAALSATSAAAARTKTFQPGARRLRDRALLATRLIEADINVATAKPERERSEVLQRARGHLAQYRLDLDPATLSILQAEIALGASDLPMAVVQASAAVALAPDSASAHYVMGTAKYRSGDKADARAQWLAALDSDSHFVPARLALAEDALAAGNSKGAEQYVIGVVRDEPGNVRGLNLFARVLLSQGRASSAEVLARRALAVDGTSTDAHVILGGVALHRKRSGEALLQFEQAILLDPRSAEAVDGLTHVYRSGVITRSMLAKLERVAAADPPSATLMEIAGRLYGDRGWFSDAERCLQSALRLDPQRTTAATALARLYASKGQLAAAADSAARTGSNSAALLAGVRAQDRNDVAAAIQSYERAVREGDRSGVAANNLAWLYAEQGTNLDRALQLAEMARALAPNNPAVLDTVGLVHLRLRRYSDAISALESARKLAGGYGDSPELLAQIRHHLSEAYLRAGKTDAAAALERP